MKVVDVTEFWSERGGGVRSYLTTKAQRLSSLGVEHQVFASGPRNEEIPLSNAENRGSRLRRFAGPALPYDPTYHLFTQLGAARRALLSERPDVLEIHSPQLAALTALATPRRAFGIRTLVWHSDFIDTYLTWKIAERSSARAAALATAPLWTWVRAITGRCSATLVASSFQASKLRAHGVLNVTAMPFGVDTSVFRPEARDPSFRARFLGNRDATLLVSVGRLSAEKRTDVLLEGFRQIRKKREARLLVFGDGPERTKLETSVRDCPDVVFLGFERNRAELARALASSDALVHAGPFETFGLVVAEARACGTPVVVASSGAAGELAARDCSEKYVACDPAAFAAALERLLARDRRDLLERARAGVSSVISIEQHFRALIALYRELLSQHGPRG
ncbi:MAG TPA: glycosyltransferase [Polyangiaceae bacterium]|jgi:alpha-1,6-mannosyltransferase|nr:glycosyltransferase [Polyangiaceae bacterium]